MKTTILYSLFAILACSFGGCSSMTPEQKAQWSATANAVTQQASTIALDEAAARLRDRRSTPTTADNK